MGTKGWSWPHLHSTTPPQWRAKGEYKGEELIRGDSTTSGWGWGQALRPSGFYSMWHNILMLRYDNVKGNQQDEGNDCM